MMIQQLNLMQGKQKQVEYSVFDLAWCGWRDAPNKPTEALNLMEHLNEELSIILEGCVLA